MEAMKSVKTKKAEIQARKESDLRRIATLKSQKEDRRLRLNARRRERAQEARAWM